MKKSRVSPECRCNRGLSGIKFVGSEGVDAPGKDRTADISLTRSPRGEVRPGRQAKENERKEFLGIPRKVSRSCALRSFVALPRSQRTPRTRRDFRTPTDQRASTTGIYDNGGRERTEGVGRSLWLLNQGSTV